MTKRQIIIGLMEMLFYRQNILTRREVDYIDNAITFLEHSEFPAWTSGHGDIKSEHPEVWMPLPDPL